MASENFSALVCLFVLLALCVTGLVAGALAFIDDLQKERDARKRWRELPEADKEIVRRYFGL